LRLGEWGRDLGGVLSKMPVCTFCKNSYEFPKGTTVVQKDASVRYYCSSKCRKNMEMGRLNKKVKWIVKSDVVKAEKAKRQADWEARQEAAKVAKK
jgi:large subunit ribosomal protein L24e